ncbi:MAG TPA: 2-oxo acid dehydrogenase subunit E2, partial [Gammaproteobacteria bacterium]|nr:2-oxo acid dehydrogenase subunit E2 [Gammaproteobacteria bacterium]
AHELGVDLSKIQGTGRKNRLISEDVKSYVKTVLQGKKETQGVSIEPFPEIDFSQWGEIEVQELNRIKKLTAKNLHRNWVNIPHVTHFDEADITELETFRQDNKHAAKNMGINLTPLAFIMKAAISSLQQYTQFNSSLSADGSRIIKKRYFHIGVAVDTPNGLVVPVVRDVDKKGVFSIAKELGELSAKAREGKLKAQEMQGSCFSISSLGSIGGTNFTPIINAPDVAILGVSKAAHKPIYQDQQFNARLMLPLALSYDHRLIDGAEAARFLRHLCIQLEDIRKLLL